MRYQDLFEGRDAPLYHATIAEDAISILRANLIEARTIHGDIRQEGNSVAGVSLTRSLRFAYEWEAVVFQFDQQKLSQRHQIFPYHYYSRTMPRLIKSEAEEFVVGPIRFLKRYLTALRVERAAYESILRTRTEENDSDYDVILNHPLLVIDGVSAAGLVRPNVSQQTSHT